MRARTGLVLAVLLMAAAAPGRAQGPPADARAPSLARPRWSAGVIGEGRLAEHRVDAGNGVELSSGTLFGGRVRLAVGTHLEVEIGGASGSLTADSAQADDATLARGAFHAALLPVPWLALRAGAEIHSYSSDFAVQRWTSARIGAEGRLRFLGGKVSGLVRFEFFPVVSVSGLAKPSRGFGAASGLTFTSGVVTGLVLYEMERHDFPQSGGVERHDQLGYLTVGLGLALGR